jgi:hypothetical protein
MINVRSDLLLFSFVYFPVQPQSIHANNKPSFIKVEFFLIWFLNLTLLFLEIVLQILQLLLLSTCINPFVIHLLEFCLFFLHLFLEIMENLTVALHFYSIFIEQFFSQIAFYRYAYCEIGSKLWKPKKL